MSLRIDDLGHETQFVVVDDLITHNTVQQFEAWLYELALGFTRIKAIGGWRGKTEDITIYRVASLDDTHRTFLAQYLLNHSKMQDVYIIRPDGMAQGYCTEDEYMAPLVNYEYDRLHGTRNTGWQK